MRKKMLKPAPYRASFASILCACVMVICSGPSAWGAPAGIDEPVVHILTDIHYLAGSLHDDGAAFKRLVYEGDGKNVELIHDILAAYRFTLEREKPEVLIVTGDLTLNGEKASHIELASWFGEVESLGIRVFVLPGNHDILNPWARGYSRDRTYASESVTPVEFRSVYRACGFDEAIARDRDSLSYVVAPAPGLRIFMLDSCRYSENLSLGYPESGGGLEEGTLEWIRANMKEAKQAGAQVLVAMHHSVVDHNPFISEGYTVYDAEETGDRLMAADIDIVLTGHVHVQDISEGTRPRGVFHDIATNALSVYPHNYGRMLVSSRKRLFSYRAIPVDVEAWAREKRIQNDRLTGFRTYSERFFRDRSALMVGRMLARMEVQLPRERASALVDLFGTLNARFFSGNAFLNATDMIHAEMYKELVAKDYGFLSSYARSIVEDPSPENNRIEIGFQTGFPPIPEKIIDSRFSF